jgi:hypothetical protein
VVFMVGNKTDADSRQVSTATAEKYAQDKGYPFMETSAKTGTRRLHLPHCRRRVFVPVVTITVPRFTFTHAWYYDPLCLLTSGPICRGER